MYIVTFNALTNSVPNTPVNGAMICTANFNRTKLVIRSNGSLPFTAYPNGVGPFPSIRLRFSPFNQGFVFTLQDDPGLVVAEWWGSSDLTGTTAQLVVIEELYRPV